VSVKRRVGALERMAKGARAHPVRAAANCYEPGNQEQLAHYDYQTDVVTLLPPGTPLGSAVVDWRLLRGLPLPAERRELGPTVRRLGEDG